MYVLQDNRFPLFANLGRTQEELEKARVMLAFPCGLVRGGLFAVGIVSEVHATIEELPACKFTLNLTPELEEE